MPEPFRVEPRIPVTAVKTYAIQAPQSTHFRTVGCTEFGCEHQRDGWQSVIDESTEMGRAQAHYIRNKSGRHFTEDRNQLPGVTVFRFEAGQECFAGGHEVRNDRPELFLVRGGDWRGNPDGSMTHHANADDWVDDFANHQDKLATQINQG